MAANLAPTIWQRFFDDNGAPLAGGKLWSYEAGTLTPLATYTDQAGLVANSNPVVLDDSGYVATALGVRCGLWLLPDSYKFILTDSNDVQIDVLDNIDSTLGVNDVTTALNNVVLYQAGPISDRPVFSTSYGQANHGRVYFATDENKAYRDTGTSWVDVTSLLFPNVPSRRAAINYTIDGGGATIGVGQKGGPIMPAACDVIEWGVSSDQTGSIVVDVKKCVVSSYPTSLASMCGANPPTLTAGRIASAEVSTLAWGSTALAKGDKLEFDVTSVTSVQRANVTVIVSLPAVSV